LRICREVVEISERRAALQHALHLIELVEGQTVDLVGY